MNKVREIYDKYFPLFLFAISFGLIFIDSYNYAMKCILGVVLCTCSICLLLKFRNNRYYIFLFGIICYVNLTICISDCFFNATLTVMPTSLAWQNLRGTVYETRFLKALCIFLSLVNLFTSKNSFEDVAPLKNKDSLFCYLFGLAILIYGLFNSYQGGMTVGDEYVSNTNAIYEYCILFFLLTWYYSGDSKIKKAILLVYSIIYIIISIIHGDRSSAFPMVMIVVILYFPRITLKGIVIFSILGIFASNIISVYRNNYSLQNFWSNFITYYGFKSICSDTVSFSYYTGITIAYVRSYLGGTLKYFWDFLIGIILGGSYGTADVTTFCRQYSMNRGGGMCVANFYFWFGYVGVIIFGIFIAYLCNRLKGKREGVCYLIKIYMVANVFRWYLYTSFDLFRGVLFVLPVSFLIFHSIDVLSIKAMNYLKRAKENGHTKKETR